MADDNQTSAGERGACVKIALKHDGRASDQEVTRDAAAYAGQHAEQRRH